MSWQAVHRLPRALVPAIVLLMISISKQAPGLLTIRSKNISFLVHQFNVNRLKQSRNKMLTNLERQVEAIAGVE